MKNFDTLKSDYEKGNISLEELTNQVRQRIESGDPEILNLCCTHPDWTEICKNGVLKNE